MYWYLLLRFVFSSEYNFADVNNLEHCAKYLNQTLVTFGFPASLDLFAHDPVRHFLFYFYFLLLIVYFTENLQYTCWESEEGVAMLAITNHALGFGHVDRKF